jgi:hypothetical protein
VLFSLEKDNIKWFFKDISKFFFFVTTVAKIQVI